MALKKIITDSNLDESLSGRRAKQIFNNRETREKKVLTTFSIEPGFKEDLEDLFSDMGLGWAAGIRFALKEFFKKYSDR